MGSSRESSNPPAAYPSESSMPERSAHLNKYPSSPHANLPPQWPGCQCMVRVRQHPIFCTLVLWPPIVVRKHFGIFSPRGGFYFSRGDSCFFFFLETTGY